MPFAEPRSPMSDGGQLGTPLYGIYPYPSPTPSSAAQDYE
jgi:hypothetical protein